MCFSPVQVFVWEQVQNRWRVGLKQAWGFAKQLCQTIEGKGDGGESKGRVIITDHCISPRERGK